MIRLYRPLAIFLLPILACSFNPSSHNVGARRIGSNKNGYEIRSATRSYLPPTRRALPTVLFQLRLPAEQTNPSSSTNGQQQQQPVLARAYSRALIIAIRCGTLFGTIDGLDVCCKASSNRDVALGQISSLRIGFTRLSSPFLKTRDFQLEGEELELGFGPLLFLTTPFLFLWRPKRTIALVLCLLLLAPRLTKRIIKGKEKKVSVATYRLGLCGADLSSPNTLLHMAVYRAMEHLLRNSVVGVFTESALAAAKVQTTATSGRMIVSPEEQTSQLAAALDEGGSTKLELKKVTIGDSGRILLDAVAAFPDPSSAGATSRLDIIVRLALSPLDEDLIVQQAATSTTTTSLNDPQDRTTTILRPNGCGIMATNAELKASFNKDTLGVPLLIFGRPIPDIWIPVVSGGIALPLGNRHRIRSIESSSQDRMDICGELYFNGEAPVQRKKNSWPFLGGSNDSSPPLPKRPPTLPGGA